MTILFVHTVGFLFQSSLFFHLRDDTQISCLVVLVLSIGRRLLMRCQHRGAHILFEHIRHLLLSSTRCVRACVCILTETSL